MKLEEPAQALTEFEASLKRAPMRLASIHGAAEAAKRAGQTEKAQAYLAQVRALTRNGDDTRAEVRSARLVGLRP